jgi:outer membrane protein OmpA-like peptidoglycan-associated protein
MFRSTYRSRRHRNMHLQEKQTQEPDAFFTKTNRAPESSPSTFFQAKLTVGQPNDQYEQEADAVANTIVNNASPGPTIQQKKISKIQRLATSEEDEKLSTNDERMRRDKEIQTKTDAGAKEEKEELQRKGDGGTSVASPALTNQIQSTKGNGEALPQKTQAEMQSSFGTDFSHVKIHKDASSVAMNNELKAHAFTHGSDIYFNKGKYNPDTSSGKHLLAHELTHVVQQSGGNDMAQGKLIQRDLAASLPTPNGVFEIDMQTREGLLLPGPPAGAQSGLSGTIKFDPATTAPYSNQIKLIQIIRDMDPRTGTPVRIGTMPPGGRQRALSTTANPLTGVEGDFHTDTLHHDPATGITAQQGQLLPLDYPFGPAGSPGGRQILGFKRSSDPADIKKAEMFDFPGTFSLANDRDFSFETVAKGEDTMTVFGALKWGFSIRSGRVSNETMSASGVTSPTFEQALELHRNFYVHEPVTFYFDFDSDVLTPTEEAKILAFLSYLSRFPDVVLNLQGFADRRGSAAHNINLANRRSNSVAGALLRGGIAAHRINLLPPFGMTEQFTPDATTDQDRDANRRGNRRVELTFEHTASFPAP